MLAVKCGLHLYFILIQILLRVNGSSYYLNSKGYPVLQSTDTIHEEDFVIKLEKSEWNVDDEGPKFDYSPPRVVTALKDAHAFLHCIVHNIGNKTVSWIRESDLHILTVDKYTYTADGRFQVIHKPNTNSWILKVNSIQTRDAGMYDCQVNTHPTDPITFRVALEVYVPTAVILGMSERYVDQGSTINLTCIIEHQPEPLVENYWYHKNKMINYDSRESLVSVITDRGPTIRTVLLIHDASDAASGSYTCMPSPSTEASVSIHILNGKTPAAMKTNSGWSMQEGVLSGLQISITACLLIRVQQIWHLDQ